MRILVIMLLAGLTACGGGGSEPVYYLDPPNIPQSHMPPPGLCRIWHSDRQPENQPPPGDCDVLKEQVPRGAILIWG